MFRFSHAFLFSIALSTSPLLAQTASVQTPNVVSSQRLPVWEIRRATIPPQISAASDDPAWERATKLGALSLSLGDGSKGLAPLPTQVLAQWDEKFLYVRFICQDSDIYTPFDKRDDPIFQGDCVEVFLDCVGDGRQVIELQLAPNGAVFDQQILLTTEAKSDENLRLTGEVIERDFWTDLGWNLKGLKTATSQGRQ